MDIASSWKNREKMLPYQPSAKKPSILEGQALQRFPNTNFASVVLNSMFEAIHAYSYFSFALTVKTLVQNCLTI